MKMKSPESYKKLSVVTSLYKSEKYIEQFYNRLSRAAEQCVDSYEIIFVDDGSPDQSAEIVKKISLKDSRVRLIELSRNFGHHQAFRAGLEFATGDFVFFIDVDLEESPEWLIDFMEEFSGQKDIDVVYGVQRDRGQGFWRKLFSNSFYKMFNILSETKIPANACTVRLMNRNFADALLKLGDKNIFLAGMMSWTGFRQHSLEVSKNIRKTKTNYSIKRLFSLFFNAVTSFSSYPLYIIFLVGLFVSLMSGLFGFLLLLKKIIYPGEIISGWTSLIASIWFLSGLIMLFLGVIGIYLSKIFIEIKNRPVFIVRKEHSNIEGRGE
jgi:putative glycosyltransferase